MRTTLPLVLLTTLFAAIGPPSFPQQTGDGSRGPAEAEEPAGPDRETAPWIDPLQKLYLYNRRGNEALDRGDVDEALREYVEAQGVAPDDPRVLYNLGNTLAQQGKTEDALSVLERAASRARTGPLARDASFNQGVLRMQHQDYEGAVRSFARALTADPGDAEARRNLELVLRRLEEEQQQQQQQQQGQGDEEEQPDQQQQDSGQENPEGQESEQQGQEGKPGQQEQDEAPGGEHEETEQGKAEPKPSPGEPGDDDRAEAARRLLQALEAAEKEALRKALQDKLPDLPDREKDW